MTGAFGRPGSDLMRLALGALLLLAGCDKPRSIGEPTQILVGTSQHVWEALEQEIKSALEPRTFTVRDERVFDIAHTDPTDAGWGNLRVMRQVLLIGSTSDPAVASAVDEHRGSTPQPPSVIQTRNVWAQNQLVTVVLLPEGAGPDAARPLLEEVGDLYLRQFEEYARSRMFVTRPNEALADSLRREAGFTLTLPQVYRYAQLEPGLFVFRNDQPDPSRLIRNVTVHSREAGEIELSPEAARAWRAELAERLNDPSQLTEEIHEASPIQHDSRPGVQIQGIWSNPPGEWPAAGPFVTRLVECGSRVFMIDTWLYAPGVPKYEYMYQLNTIMNSFRCA